MSFDVGLGVAIFGAVLAVPALAIAVRTDRKVDKTLQNVTEAVNDLRDVREGLSTRSLGGFPNYFSAIVDLLEDAERKVDVLCDLPAYGAFSDRQNWLTYRNELNKLKVRSGPPENSFSLRIACLAPLHRERLLNDQFPLARWAEFLGKPSFRAKLDAFQTQRGIQPLDSPNAHARFIQELMSLHAEEEVFLSSRSIDAILPLYCWIADDARAVFAVASLPREPAREAATGTTREVGFLTSDPNLIAALRAVIEQYLEFAEVS